MKAETIAVGSELLLGQIVNTNAMVISKALQQIGIDVYYHTCVGDNSERLKEVFQAAFRRSDVIILTGGLGPTMDDMTKETVSSFLKLSLKTDETSLEHLKKIFELRGITPTENNYKQAMIPQGSVAIPNRSGTAPGILLNHNDKIIVMLPGPPFEMEPMLMDTVIPYLSKFTNNTIHSKVLKFYGIGESALEESIKDLLIKQTNPTIAPLAKKGEVTVRITAKADNRESAICLIEPVEREIRARLDDYFYGYDYDMVEEIVVKLLKTQGKTIGVAESCTGGLMAHRITNVPGASACFERGVVCYSNNSKVELLCVSPDTLNKYGAVSEQAAREMAEGLRVISRTDIGVSITGVAGPDGGTKQKPVGLVYIGYADVNGVEVFRHMFTGKRIDVKERSVNSALHTIRLKLLECR
ncbi:MAG: competence/damage-inducible protein A [Thermoanaerobacterales bacterium]|jgi:nicotinamide-nucleotide amidase|nr:competence/damage-inducible protein A [Thermoanaerobacterales bacterium]